MSLTIVPMTIRGASEFVQHHHRHHKPPRGGIFAIGCENDGELVGVAIIGRPVAKGLQDGRTAEVTRLCTLDSPRAKHAASKLYATAWRAVQVIGYRRLLTYTLESEAGTSLVAAGWEQTGRVRGRSWSTPTRPRADQHPLQDKICWEPA